MKLRGLKEVRTLAGFGGRKGGSRRDRQIQIVKERLEARKLRMERMNLERERRSLSISLESIDRRLSEIADLQRERAPKSPVREKKVRENSEGKPAEELVLQY